MSASQSGNRTIAVVGCGLIGESWAALFLHHGFDVLAWDPNDVARDSFAQRTRRPLGQLAELAAPAGSLGRLTVVATVEEAVAGAALVQENAPENIPVKHALYTQIEAAAAPDCIIASSTSALRWSDLSPGMAWPERLITAHPFNPPHLVPLVEMFGPDAQVLDRAEAIYRAIGREPVRMTKEATGHIANRLASALWREAVHLVAEGIADVGAIDAALKHGPGLRWSVVGAHMAYHLGGGPGGIGHYLSHLGPSQERRWASLGSPSLTPEVCAQIVQGIEAEASGRTIATLEAERDAALIAVLRARKTAGPV
ncbi:MAG: 3-hydroxyacyl-CoA dehydrogenase NAD-binding domain-containing protein [Paracoccaceae bacterium]